MNSLTLRKKLDKFIEEIDKSPYFLAALTAIADYAPGINKPLDALSLRGNISGIADTPAKEIYQFFSETKSITSKINNRALFRELENFQTALRDFYTDQPPENQHGELEHKLEEFANNYDNFLSNTSNGPAARALIFSAQDLRNKIKTLIDAITQIRITILPTGMPNSMESELSIFLPEQTNLREFSAKLNAIQEIYSELCLVFYVSETDTPLRIGKIESGSLWVLLFGNSKIIETIKSLIESSASYIYRNHTKEGKIGGLPKKVEAIDNLLGLSERLKENGIDTTQIKINIEKAAISLSAELSTLMDGQASITVNDQKIPLQEEQTKALIKNNISGVRKLENTKNPLLESDQKKPPQDPDYN